MSLRTTAAILAILVCPDAAPFSQASADEPRRPSTLSQADCYAALDRAGIDYERPETSGVAFPVRLRGPVGGVEIQFEGRRAQHRIMDCRLVVALSRWAPRLREAGVARIRHLSAYRARARHRRTGRPSGHASGLAIDLRFFDGEGSFDVLEHWQPRTRGAAPCERPDAEDERSRKIRELVCEAIDQDLFQVVVTPHHDDAHANHVHVEVVPGVPWTWVR
ncbi:MAG: extensin family protein [Myxococcota bacterium]